MEIALWENEFEVNLVCYFTGSRAGCTVKQQQGGRTCDVAPSHTYGSAACRWRSSPVLSQCPAGWELFSTGNNILARVKKGPMDLSLNSLLFNTQVLVRVSISILWIFTSDCTCGNPLTALCINLDADLVASVHKVLGQFSVLSLCHPHPWWGRQAESSESCCRGQLSEMYLKSAVWRVKRKTSQDGSLLRPHTADNLIQLPVSCPTRQWWGSPGSGMRAPACPTEAQAVLWLFLRQDNIRLINSWLRDIANKQKRMPLSSGVFEKIR